MTFAWQAKGNKEQCEYNSKTVSDYARKFPRGHGLSCILDQKKNGTDKPDGSWDQTAQKMMENFSGSSYPIFRASSAFERGELRRVQEVYTLQW